MSRAISWAGIIPARAGFTARPGAGHRAHRDHPRSRGVYDAVVSTTIRTPGSSPLARGLRSSASTRSTRSGIIPARAGFTPPLRPSRLLWADHPRSRGVYDGVDGPATIRSGSSPLARGLQPSGDGGAGDEGIIPARAGFTKTTPGERARRRDHPRSRGVYACGGCPPQGAAGSSPLARGLPSTAGSAAPGIGIIPARAGFTVPASHGAPPPRDHPRSRGVYVARTS